MNNALLEAFGCDYRLLSEDDTVFVQACSWITGVMDGGEEGDFNIETLCLWDKTLAAVDPLEYAKLMMCPSRDDAFDYAFMKIGHDPDAEQMTIIITAPVYDLEAGFLPLLELPRLLTPEGKDIGRLSGSPNRFEPSRTPPPSSSRDDSPSPSPSQDDSGAPTKQTEQKKPILATFSNIKEDELERKCRELQDCVNKCLKHPTEGLLRRKNLSKVTVDEDTCLVTGDPYPRNISNYEKLDRHSMSQYSANQEEVAGLCLICTKNAYDARKETDPSFDPEDYDQLYECYCFGRPGATHCGKCAGIGGRGQPLHPHPHLLVSGSPSLWRGGDASCRGNGANDRARK